MKTDEIFALPPITAIDTERAIELATEMLKLARKEAVLTGTVFMATVYALAVTLAEGNQDVHLLSATREAVRKQLPDVLDAALKGNHVLTLISNKSRSPKPTATAPPGAPRHMELLAELLRVARGTDNADDVVRAGAFLAVTAHMTELIGDKRPDPELIYTNGKLTPKLKKMIRERVTRHMSEALDDARIEHQTTGLN